MDTADVSNIGQYVQLLHAQSEIMEAAVAREGQLPADRKGWDELIHNQRMMTMQMETEQLESMQFPSSFFA